MKKSGWKSKIIKACKSAGTYEDHFDAVIETLAGILEKRDDAAEQYQKLGAVPIIRYTNKGGATNPAKNPALVLWDDLNKSALAYWRELGLTPASYKKMTGDAPQKEKRNGLTDLLEMMRNELKSG